MRTFSPISRSFSLVFLLGAAVLGGCEMTEDDPEGEGSGNPDTSSCLIEGEVTSASVITGTACAIRGNVNITGPWEIPAGTTFIAEADASIYIDTDGAIIAKGTAAKPIVFKGRSATTGFWRGIIVESRDARNELTFVTISHGGSATYYSSEAAGLYVKDNAKLTISDSTVDRSGGVGFYVEDGADLLGFSRNTFTANVKAAAKVGVNQLGKLDDASNYAGTTANTEPFVDAFGGRWNAGNATWAKPNLPIRFLDIFTIESGDVAVKPGTTLTFVNDAGIYVDREASFSAKGTAAEPIVFAGAVETTGAWTGVIFDSNNPKNELDHVEIVHAGQRPYYSSAPAGVYLKDDSQLKLTNSTIGESGGTGLYVEASGKLAAFAANTFLGNVGPAATVATDTLGKLDDASDYAGEGAPNASAEGGPYIAVHNGNANGNATWPAANAPIRFLQTVDLQTGTFTIAAGANFEFASDAGLYVETEAALNATGTDAARITFQGAVETNGYWTGLIFESNNPQNRLEFVDVTHAGSRTYYSGEKAAVYVKDSSRLTVKDAALTESGGWGLFAEEGANLVEEGITYAGNTLGDRNPE